MYMYDDPNDRTMLPMDSAVATVMNTQDELSGLIDGMIHYPLSDLYDLIDGIAVMIAGIDDAGNIVLWNRTCVETTGYTALEIIGTSALDLTIKLAPDYLLIDDWNTNFQAILEMGKDSPGTPLHLKTKSGAIRKVVSYAIDGRPPFPNLAWWGFGIDVTKELDAELQYREEEARHLRLLENFPDLLIDVDARGTIVGFSPKKWRSEVFTAPGLEFTLDQIIGLNAFDVFSTFVDSIPEARLKFERAMKTGSVEVIDFDWFEGHEQFSREIRIIPVDSDRCTAVIRNNTKERRALTAERQQRLMAETLREVGSIITSTLDKQDIFDRIFEQSSRVIPNDGVNVVLLNEAGLLDLHHYKGSYIKFTIDWAQLRKPGDLLNYRTMTQTLKPLIIADTFTHPAWVRVNDVRSYAGAPLVSHGEVIGFLNFDSFTPNAFNSQLVDRLQTMATYVTIALENSRLYEEARRGLHS